TTKRCASRSSTAGVAHDGRSIGRSGPRSLADYNCDGSVGYADADGDGYPACSDCDDGNGTVNPDAEEVCDEADNDCDLLVDEAGAVGEAHWFADNDGDGYGDAQRYEVSCTAPAGYVSDSRDCNDATAYAHPGGVEVCDGLDNDCDGDVDNDATDAETWYADGDADGYGNALVRVRECVAPLGFVLNSEDCDDEARTTHPQATERCDLVDNDCDEEVDEGVTTTFYQDGDGDGFGRDGVTAEACASPPGFARVGGDCDDEDRAAFPGGVEVCDDADNDCDGEVNEGLTQTWYLDSDADGYGKSGVSKVDCEQPIGWASEPGDCDDGNSAANPGATEVCDDRDNDCDSQTDEGFNKTWYIDYDGDDYGKTSVVLTTCTPPPGWVSTSGDCNDLVASVNPSGHEVCDGVDNDCNGSADDDDAGVDTATFVSWYADVDLDGYGDVADEYAACAAPEGYVGDATDCDDSVATGEEINPGAEEVWYDGVDQDCDGASDNDRDGDGHDAEEHGGDDCDDEDASRFELCQLYEFASHTFTSCGVTGRSGPSLAQCRAHYSTPWDESTANLNMTTNGIQLWTVPETGTYRITAFGAAGQMTSSSYTGGAGAMMQGEFSLVQGEVLQILVGQMGGANTTHGNENGGGGGTFVVRQAGDVPLIVAAGGGGAPARSYGTSCSRTYGEGLVSMNGKTVTCSGSYTGTGGTGGNGGYSYNSASSYAGGAGGGFYSGGTNGYPHCATPGGGASFLNGGVGGVGNSCYSPAPEGGFGGGGAGGLGAPGGGGGYSGGGAGGYWSSYSDWGGGGGSYNVGSNQANAQGANPTAGYVSVTLL
ncbi:MAG: putative metal-binding motif-containing protein, partial [Deltaproteobacteria bacterium]|nr:putative metal-binding motif-containing protein [Deltaproteobacteria bacterium]